MKKILCLAIALVMCACVFASCAQNEDKLIVGYTIYEPMNYEKDGKLVGFDTELAEAVAKELGIEVEFKLIQWSNKYLELESGNVNCLWNGFTSNCADDDGIQRSEKVDFSHAYMRNEQVVVIRKADESKYATADSLKGVKGAAEAGSAGEGVAKGFIGDDSKYTACTAQTATLTELMGNKVEFVVIDKTMAKTLIGNGNYADLMMVESIEIPAEEYSIGFKKGSELTEKVNGALETLAANGTMTELAEKYGLENYVITDFN
ncbi:MAG: transporter substrate-binding domain-containing protein [Clostridia bacterium]|nr:transporter substrate-binding domain-containing protein [Clostridia bacterium]